ncbi:MAG: endo alpha-1,4 polygalactosaminidase [Synechococcales cyanobacterium T60_A2020_003]|nr:endo alpha-1,4 polygalactosaminidase [Synechococcales cyanobacterium T60_A2020_003]
MKHHPLQTHTPSASRLDSEPFAPFPNRASSLQADLKHSTGRRSPLRSAQFQAQDRTMATTGQPLVGADWLYQLQLKKDSIRAIASTSFDLVTIDYSQDGSQQTAYTREDLDVLHASGKTVLAYLSIGEAEDYRYYFKDRWVTKDPKTGLKQPDKDAPAWLGRTNPQWRGNYKVKYWNAEWQSIVLGYVDRILNAGFDGVYLDIVDGFEYWSQQNNGESVTLSRRKAANRMISLVETIAQHTRIDKGQSSFHIVPQNAETILKYDRDGSYLKTISGIGVEDVFYDETHRQPQSEVNYRLPWLQQIRDAGKPVLSVDYVDTNGNSNLVYEGKNLERINLFRDLAIAQDFIPYVAKRDRELNEIVTIPGIQPNP